MFYSNFFETEKKEETTILGPIQENQNGSLSMLLFEDNFEVRSNLHSGPEVNRVRSLVYENWKEEQKEREQGKKGVVRDWTRHRCLHCHC